METMISVWTMVEHVRVASGAAELVIFTAIIYWFFTSSRVADMLEVVGERVGGWCGRDTSSSLRQAVRMRRRPHHQDVYTKIDADNASRTAALYKLKESPSVPAPVPQTRPPAGLACARCAPLSRESWQDPNTTDTGAVINILDIGRQNFANGGMVSRYLCDIAQCCKLVNYDYKDVVPNVVKDESVQRAIEDSTQRELTKLKQEHQGSGDGSVHYSTARKRVEARALKIIQDISSAMSTNVLKFVAWVCHKSIRRVASGGCSTRAASIERLRRANAAGLPLVFVPLHRSHFDYILVTFVLYLTGLRPPLVAAGDNMRIPFFGWFLRGCGAFYIRRRVEGSDYHSDTVYKSALRAYILNSLGARNNLEFFIEGGRTRTGKPQTPKAGILSVILDAYIDGTIDDALLVPVTLNYDKLVDGNFVREQLGMPKQMETFWSALRGIWWTLNTDHGSIRVDFNQPISLKELVTSFQKYQHFKAPLEMALSPPNNNLAANLDKQILYNHSHSSLYGADVSADHKMMVEAIGRHLVYDAAQATALMCTNVAAYVLVAEARGGATLHQLHHLFLRRHRDLLHEGRDLGYSGDERLVLKHALERLGRSVARVRGAVRAARGVAPSLELGYYANALVAHYAAPAVVATALESIVLDNAETVSHAELLEASLELCSVMSHEFILSAPCQPLRDRMLDTIDTMLNKGILISAQNDNCIDEELWSRRFAERLEQDDTERPDPALKIKYKLANTQYAIAERKRLLLTLRPLLEAYSQTCRVLHSGTMKEVVKNTLDSLTELYTHNKMIYGEAVSTDAITNCLRLLRQWGVIEMYMDNKTRMLRICDQYQTDESLQEVCKNIYKFNMDTPLLSDK